MLKLTFNKNKYEVADKWSELSKQQFLQLLDLITDFFTGKFSVFEFRIMTVLIVTGLKPRRIRKTEKEMLRSENIYRISKNLPFPLRIEYKNNKSIDRMKTTMREQLSRFLPEELDQTLPEVRWATKAKKQIVPDFVFAANLIPQFKCRRKTLTGYKFNLDGRILTASLTAAQYIEAQTAYNQYVEYGEKNMLQLLVAILYCPGKYSGETAMALSKTLHNVDHKLLDAIFINFQAIQHFLTTRTKYNLLFSAKNSKRKAGSSQPGLESVVFSLIKSGVQNAEEMNLIKFFELMYNDIVSNVTQLHQQNIPVDKIAEQTGLPISKINQIL